MKRKFESIAAVSAKDVSVGLPCQVSRQAFGYVPSTRLRKLGKRVLVYRKPGAIKRTTIAKPLFYVMALLLAAFAAGYVSNGHDPVLKESRILPASAVPTNTLKRLITISAASDTVIPPASVGIGRNAPTGQTYRTV